MNRLTPKRQQQIVEYLLRHYRAFPSGRVYRRDRTLPLKPGNRGRYKHYDFRIGGTNVHVYAHIVVWVLTHGEYPRQQIDHINGDRTDNRPANLRLCSPSENMYNRLLDWRPNAATGVPGVDECKGFCKTTLGFKTYYFHSPYAAFFYATLCGKRYR